MTLDDLRSEVYQRLRLDSTASGADETFVTRALNQGVLEILTRTHCYVKCADVATIADTWKYRMPTSVLAFKRLLTADSSSEDQEAIQVAESELFDLRRSQLAVATTSTRMRYALMGADLLLVWPTPTAAGTIDAFYVPYPTAMSSGSHDPATETYGGIQAQYHPAIYLWALAQAADREQHTTSQAGLKYRAEFDDYIKRIRIDLNRRKGPLPRARIGNRRALVPSRNDIDLGW